MALSVEFPTPNIVIKEMLFKIMTKEMKVFNLLVYSLDFIKKKEIASKNSSQNVLRCENQQISARVSGFR